MMGDKTKHLVRVGHEFAAAMSDDTPIITIAKMVTELASALDVQTARSEALAAKLNDVCAENAALREHRPQPSGAAMMEALDAFYEYHEDVPEQGMMAAFEILCCKRPETPNTDAWVNEQRAVGADSAIESAKKEIASEFQYQSFDNCISACARHPQSYLSGKVEMVAWLEWFAAQLRGGQV